MDRKCRVDQRNCSTPARDQRLRGIGRRLALLELTDLEPENTSGCDRANPSLDDEQKLDCILGSTPVWRELWGVSSVLGKMRKVFEGVLPGALAL